MKGCPTASGINFESLAEKTDGFSGADIVGLCERAKQIPFREAILEGTDRPLQATDLETALTKVRPSVTPDNLRRYEGAHGPIIEAAPPEPDPGPMAT